MLWCNYIHKYNTIILWLSFTTRLWCNYIYIYHNYILAQLNNAKKKLVLFLICFVFFVFWCFRLNAILKKFIQQLLQHIIIFTWINRPDTSLCPVFCTFHVKLCYHYILGTSNSWSKLTVLTYFGHRCQREQTY